jgi:hypothetical protein
MSNSLSDKEGHSSQMLREDEERRLGLPSQSLAPWHNEHKTDALRKLAIAVSLDQPVTFSMQQAAGLWSYIAAMGGKS